MKSKESRTKTIRRIKTEISELEKKVGLVINSKADSLIKKTILIYKYIFSCQNFLNLALR